MSYDLREAFQELAILNEAEEFNLSDEEQIKKMDDFMKGDEFDEVQMVIDVDAEGMDELEPSYEGKIICQCPICKSLVYKAEEDIVEDPTSEYVNVEEACPYCREEGGLLIVGQVAPYTPHEEPKEDEVEVKDEVEIEDKPEEIEMGAEEEVKDEVKEESLNESLTEKFEEFKVVDKTGKEIKDGDEIVDFRGDKSIFKEITRAPGGNSTGKIYVEDEKGWAQEYYPQVFGLKIVKKVEESLDESLGRYADTDAQEEILRFLEKCAKKANISIRFGTKVGKYPQRIIIDHKHEDGAISISGNGSMEIGNNDFGTSWEEEVSYEPDDYFEDDVIEALKGLDESLNEGANEELAMQELKEVVANFIYDEFLEGFDDNIALRVHSAVPSYNIDWCNEEGDNFIAEGVDQMKHSLARKVTDALFANAPRELGEECGKLEEADKPAAIAMEDAQKWVDYDMEHYGKISDKTNDLVKKAGFQIIKDDHGDYEVAAGKYESMEGACPNCGKNPCECSEECQKLDEASKPYVLVYEDDGNDHYGGACVLQSAAELLRSDDSNDWDKAWEDEYWSDQTADDPSILLLSQAEAQKLADKLNYYSRAEGKVVARTLNYVKHRLLAQKEDEEDDYYEDLDTESLDKLISEKLGKTYVTESGYVDGKKITLEGTLEGQPAQFTFEAKQHEGGLSLISEQFVIKGHVENKNIICEDIADSFKEIADGLEEVTGQIRQAANDVEFEAEQVRVGAEEIEGNEKFEGLKEATKRSKIEGTTVCEDLQDALDAVRTAETELEKEIANKQLKNKTFQKAYKAAHADECLDEARLLLTRNKVVDWLEDHEQAAEDCKHHLGVDDLEKADLNDMLDWIADHETLKDDFLHRFGKGWFREALNPNFDKEKYGKYFDDNNKLIPELADEYFALISKQMKEIDEPKEVEEACKKESCEEECKEECNEAAPKMSSIKGSVGDIIKTKIFPRMDEISTKEELVKIASDELAKVDDKAKAYAKEVLDNLKKKDYYKAAVYLGNVMLAGENLRSPDVKLKDSLEEATLTEKKWDVELESGKALRNAIDSEDGAEIKEALKNCYKEINRKLPEAMDDDALEDMIEDLDIADFEANEEVGIDEDEAQETIDLYLGDFWDFCDGYNIWVGM